MDCIQSIYHVQHHLLLKVISDKEERDAILSLSERIKKMNESILSVAETADSLVLMLILGEWNGVHILKYIH